MAVSVRMEPLLERELEQAARRQGVTKSQFIIAAVERALGRKDVHRNRIQSFSRMHNRYYSIHRLICDMFDL